ncbi:MAG: hypothetical protein Ct9H90mP8_0910 [Pseudomonadota bacterium]|nr:MAG: hypothetical protein Ct9H90mP8_0910 [Pseudomonadota bacterium]
MGECSGGEAMAVISVDQDISKDILDELISKREIYFRKKNRALVFVFQLDKLLLFLKLDLELFFPDFFPYPVFKN